MSERVHASLALPHMSDDQVGGRDEEVSDPLESCAAGSMHFSYACLWNHLCGEQIFQISSYMAGSGVGKSALSVV